MQTKLQERCEKMQAGGGVVFIFTPKIGEMIQFDEHIFQRAWFNHQLASTGPQ